MYLADLLVEQHIARLIHHGGGAGEHVAALGPLHFDLAHPDVQGQNALPVVQELGQADHGGAGAGVLVDHGAGALASCGHRLDVPGPLLDVVFRAGPPAAAVDPFPADHAVDAAFVVLHGLLVLLGVGGDPLLDLSGGDILLQHGVDHVGGVLQDLLVLTHKGADLQVQIVRGHSTQLIGGAVGAAPGEVHPQKGEGACEDEQQDILK